MLNKNFCVNRALDSLSVQDKQAFYIMSKLSTHIKTEDKQEVKQEEKDKDEIK